MSQRKLLEELRGGSVQQRSADAFAASNDVNETALMQRLQHGANGDTTDFFDLCAANGLPIRDDGQRFEGSRRESLRPHRDLGALDGLGELGTGKDLPAASLLHQLDPMAIDVVVLAQLVERRRGCRR